MRTGWVAAVFVTACLLTSSADAQESSPATADPKITFDGAVALWTIAVKPDKTADFEQVMTRLREALARIGTPEAAKQAAGWKVLRLTQPLPDGNVAYLHLVNPVVPGADYSVMHALYAAFPEERQALYDLYRGAFAKNLSLATGQIAVDLAVPSPQTAVTQ